MKRLTEADLSYNKYSAGNPDARYEVHLDKNSNEPYVKIENHQIVTTTEPNRMDINTAREIAHWSKEAGYNVSISYVGDD